MNIVAIVGRPNVGKSTLFNKLIGERYSITEKIPGVTRDRVYGKSEWNGKIFTLIDTGGFVPNSEDLIEKAIREQALIALDEADVIVFVCDAKDGITPFDIDIANILRSSKKPVILVINKADNHNLDLNSYEFHKLGLGEPYPISALSGRNTGDFLDALSSFLKDEKGEEVDPRLKIAIVGRPNVGKSSLVNALLGKSRSIVTPIPGTTRDAIDSILKYYNEEIVLIDTAGLRKRSQIKEHLEFLSTVRTIKAIQRCDVAVILIDATLGLEAQDKKIINQIEEERKGIIIAINKWDLIEKDEKTADIFKKNIQQALQTYYYVPIIFISAQTKQRIIKIIETAKQIKSNRQLRIPTSKLNEELIHELEKTPPPSIKGKDLRINYITQVKTEPPVFTFFCNHPQLIPDSYKRFIEKKIREKFDFTGTPISFIFRKKNTKKR